MTQREGDPRTVPGGPTPARTPGGTGPSTRDTQRAVTDHVNEALIGRTELAGELQVKPAPARGKVPVD